MKVTRDVIYDLLPGYFAGELSGDSRELVNEFLASDPEFARMTERFRTLYADRPPSSDTGPSSREKATFERARTLAERRSQSLGGGIGFTLGALFALGMGLFSEVAIGGFVIAMAFGIVAAMSWVSWYIAGRQMVSDRHY